MKNKLITLFLPAVVLFASCKPKPVDVIIDQSISDSLHRKILVDGKTTFNLTGDSTVVVKLTQGEHFIQINDSAKRNFTVTENGGILNLDKKEYVVFDLKYTASGNSTRDLFAGMEPEEMKVRNIIMIDSFLIFPHAGKLSSSDSALRELLPDLLEQKNDPAKINRYNSGMLRLVGKDSFYVAKDWDYNMTDSIPETISVDQREIGSSTRTTILRSRIFLLSLLLTEDQKEYTVKSIHDIREGANDKKSAKEDKESSKEKAKENKKKEMDF